MLFFAFWAQEIGWLPGSIHGMTRRFKIMAYVVYRLGFIWIQGGRMVLTRLLTQKRRREDLGEFYKRLCEGLGGTFIKVGQALAMRQDFLPPAQCEALSHLLDRVRPFPSCKGHRMVERELGGKLSAFFMEFGDDPVASASFSQVYRARTLEGVDVAVKVMRPGMDYVVHADTFLLLATAYSLNVLGFGRQLGFLRLAQEVVEVLKNELDYPREGRYLQIFQEHVQAFPYLEVPLYFPKLSGLRVLTMSYIEGVTLKSMLSQLRAHPDAVVMDAEGQPIDGSLVGSRIYEVTMRSVFQLGFYHADLHPGNIVLLPGNRIGLIDFGIVGVLGRDLREKNLKYVQALADKRFEDAADIYAQIVQPHARADYQGLRHDMLILLKAWSIATANPNASFKEKSSGTVLNESVDMARKHHFYLPRHAVLYYKTVMMIDHLNIELNPRYDSLAEAEKFVYEHQLYTLSHALTYEKWQRYWVEVVDSLDQYPEAVSNTLKFLQQLEPKRDKNPLVLVAEHLVRLLRNATLALAVAWPALRYVADVAWLCKWDGWDVGLFVVAMLVGASQLNGVLLRLRGQNPPSD